MVRPGYLSPLLRFLGRDFYYVRNTPQIRGLATYDIPLKEPVLMLPGSAPAGSCSSRLEK